MYLDKQLSTAMTQQLMKANLHLKWRAFPLDEQILQNINLYVRGNSVNYIAIYHFTLSSSFKKVSFSFFVA